MYYRRGGCIFNKLRKNPHRSRGLCMTTNLEMPGGDEQPVISSSERLASSLPLSFAQQQLWLLCQEQSALNLQAVFRLEGTLEFQALRRAFDELLRRHEGLRTRVEANDGSPV